MTGSQLSRRGLLGCFIAAPAIVRAGSLMRVRGLGAEIIRAQGVQEAYNKYQNSIFAVGDVIEMQGKQYVVTGANNNVFSLYGHGFTGTIHL